MDHHGTEKLLQQYHQYQAEDTEQTASRPVPGSLKPDPRLFHKPGDNKPHHLPDVTISVVHHLLRIDEELAACRIIHRIRLERDVYEGEAAEHKSGEEQPVFFFRMGVQIPEQFRGEEQTQDRNAKTHTDILRRMDPQVISENMISTINAANRTEATRSRGSFHVFTTIPPARGAAVVVCPLGKEYPVAVTMALPAGTIRLSRIQGRYTQAVSFTSGVITMQK